MEWFAESILGMPSPRSHNDDLNGSTNGGRSGLIARLTFVQCTQVKSYRPEIRSPWTWYMLLKGK